MCTLGRLSVLRVVDLRAGYGTTPVLDGVDLEVQPGEMVAVLGRNGVGKTTLLRTIMGLLPTRGGQILWNGGTDIGRLPAHRRARLGLAYVPQGREIFAGLSVRENLRLGAMARARDADRRVEVLLSEFGVLRGRLAARGGSLSGGQQQLLALARGLIASPKMLLLDEPSEGIQPSFLEQILERVRAANRDQGVAVLLVEQNLEFAGALAERAYIMNKGRVVHELPVAKIVDDPEIQREYMGV